MQNALRGSPNCQDQESCKDWEWCGSHKPHAPKAHAAHSLHSTAETQPKSQVKTVSEARLKQRERRCSLWQPHCVAACSLAYCQPACLLACPGRLARTLLFTQFGNEPQLSQISSRFWLATPTRPTPPHTHTH